MVWVYNYVSLYLSCGLCGFVSVCVLQDDGPIDYNVYEKVEGTMSWQLVILGTNRKSDVGVYDSVGFIRYPKENNCFFFY